LCNKSIVGDILRAGHFSVLSSAEDCWYPNQAPKMGYLNRPLGLVALWHSDHMPWTNQIKDFISNNYPVIILQRYSDDDLEGHYRVVIGYNDTSQQMVLHDPWGREDQPPTITMPYSQFESFWNYTEQDTHYTYWGSVIAPLSVEATYQPLSDNEGTVSFTASYPCPSIFDCSQFPILSNTIATIQVPENIILESAEDSSFIGSISPAQTVHTKWQLTTKTNAKAKLLITVKGVAHGSTLQIICCHDTLCPGHQYIDIIGTSIELYL